MSVFIVTLLYTFELYRTQVFVLTELTFNNACLPTTL